MTQKERLIELLEANWSVFSHVDCELLADYLLSNGVIVPQYKTGETIFVVDRIHERVIECLITDIGLTLEVEYPKALGIWGWINEVISRKSIYRSKAEAEQALKEMEQ